MIHLEVELKQLKSTVLEMSALVLSQLKKSKDAYINWDTALAYDIIHHEKMLNAMELGVDRECEKLFALFNPVATDLRFVIAVLKINSDLERIGDYASGIADYIVQFDHATDSELVEMTHLPDMFDIAINMAEDIRIAIEKEDISLAREVYLKDAELNTINKNASNVISTIVLKNPELIRQSLFIFSTIRKLERVGDHIKNIAEDLIFYVDAEVLKHKDKLD